MQTNTQALKQLVHQFFQNQNGFETLSDLQIALKKNYDFFINNFSKDEMIKLLNKISALYLEIGVRNQGEQHEDIFSKIRSHFYKSDKIEINENRTILLKGFYYFFLNDFKRAQDHFFNANNTKTDTLPYLCGKGFIEYWKKNYKNAIEYFKHIFLHYRKSFPEVYYLLGVCFFKLNQFDLAQVCFKYLLRKKLLNQSTIAASLAIIYLINKDYDQYYQMIQLGYTQNQKDINLVLNLAMHYFYKDEFDRCEKLTQLALSLLDNFSMIFDSESSKFDNKLLKSEIYYLLGYIEQQRNTKEGYDQAYKYYQISLENNDENYPTMFGLGQIYFYQKNYVKSQNCFENIISHNSDNICRECYLILPHVYMRLQQQDKVVSTFEKALFFFPDDLQLKIDFCSYLEIFDQKKCLKLYSQIYENFDMENNKILYSIQLLNNMSIIFTVNNHFEKSSKILTQALLLLEQQKVEMDEVEYAGIKNIILFNKSFYLQKTGQFTKAQKLLHQIVDSQPGFTECYLQLAKLYQEKQDYVNAQFNIDKSLFVSSKMQKVKDVEYSINLKLHQYLKSRNYHQATQLVNTVKNDDLIFTLLKATLYYYYVVYNREEVLKSKNYMQASAELCRKILANKTYAKNYKAANLVACLLAERGRFSENQIKKGDNLIYNTALSEFLRQNYEKSLSLLESPLSSYKLQQNVLYAIVLTQLEQFNKAEKNWKFQILRKPNLKNYYNLATFYKQKATILFKRNIKKVNDLKRMLQYLKFCQNVFEKVNNEISNDVFRSFSSELNKQEVERQSLVKIKENAYNQISYLQRNKETFEAIIKKEQEKIEQRKNSKEQRQKIIQQKRLEQEQKKLQEEIMKKQREEMLEKRAQENMQKINGFQFQWGEKKEKKKKSVIEKVMDENRKQRNQDSSKRLKKQDLQEGDQQLVNRVDDSSSDDEQEYDPMNQQYEEQENQIQDDKEDIKKQKIEQAKKARENLLNEIVPKKRRGMILSDEDDQIYQEKLYLKVFQFGLDKISKFLLHIIFTQF